MKIINKFIKSDQGFTLIEIIIVIVVLSIMAMLVTPRLSSYFANERKNFNLLSSLIAKTYDDSFMHGRINYLAIHLNEPFVDENFDEDREEVFSRNNAISVLSRIDGKFVDHERKALRYRQFSDNYILEDVILNNGQKVTQGSVIVPFYPQGYSDNIIIHIRTDDTDQWSIRIYKHLKEPEVKFGYITFEDDEE